MAGPIRCRDRAGPSPFHGIFQSRRVAAKRIVPRVPNTDLPVPRREEKPAPSGAAHLSGLASVEVEVTLELGRTEITLEEAMKLGEKSLLAVDRTADEPVEVRVNGKLLGRGRLVMVGGNYGVQLTEVVDQAR